MFWGDEQTAFFESVLFQVLGQTVEVIETQFLAGGNINTSAQVFSSEGVFFVKWNHADPPDLFATEAQGLELLAKTNTVRVPAVVGHGQQGDKSFLVLEYLDAGEANGNYWEDLGHALAELHSHSQAQFGLGFDNYIGSLPQRNTPTDHGATFFFEQRLLPQAGLALYKGILPKTLYEKFFRLRDRLPDLLPNERPALLHGDLWTGNVLVLENGRPALIDPSVYYGYREIDLAFSRLFGGFDGRFYAAYQDVFPLEDGHEERTGIFNLYPLLVHANLFGPGYVSGIERILKKF